MKTVTAMYLLTFGSTAVSMFVGTPTVAGVAFAALGAFAVGVGVLLATKVNGAATDWAAAIGGERRFGVDDSGSVFARPGFVRFFGLPMAAIGIVFIGVGISQAI